MRKTKTKMLGMMATLVAILLLSAALAGPAFAHHDFHHEDAKCNSGNGNGSETNPDNDCDPGNSGGKNNGGD